MSNKNIGSSLDDFLHEDGIYDHAHNVALKRIIAFQISEAMKERHISKNKMAKLMHTSRTQVDRFLDPENTSVQLNTIQKAATVVGRRVVIALEPVSA